MKKLKLKQSVKEKIQAIALLTAFVLVMIWGLNGMKVSAKNYNENYLNQTKMTEMLATDQSK